MVHTRSPARDNNTVVWCNLVIQEDQIKYTDRGGYVGGGGGGWVVVTR